MLPSSPFNAVYCSFVASNPDEAKPILTTLITSVEVDDLITSWSFQI